VFEIFIYLLQESNHKNTSAKLKINAILTFLQSLTVTQKTTLMKENLNEIFQNVNDWLKFAEAKHAGLIVLNSGIIFGILSVYKDYKSHLHLYCILATFILIGFSITMTLWSLFPVTKNYVDNKKKPSNPNLYFFGSLAQLDETDFKHELLKIEPNHKFEKLENDLINQILVNSTIATRKYKLFKSAIISTSVGLSIPLIYILIKLICH
jgi:hypothetical protein